MRFDDHRGLIPSTIRLVAGSLRGTLVRTKTSGAGKRREELYLHIDAGAFFFHKSWISVGRRLWEDLGTNRDYFLLVPAPGFNGVLHLEAQYSDSHACSNLLLRRLRHTDGAPLLSVDGASFFWGRTR